MPGSCNGWSIFLRISTNAHCASTTLIATAQLEWAPPKASGPRRPMTSRGYSDFSSHRWLHSPWVVTSVRWISTYTCWPAGPRADLRRFTRNGPHWLTMLHSLRSDPPFARLKHNGGYDDSDVSSAGSSVSLVPESDFDVERRHACLLPAPALPSRTDISLSQSRTTLAAGESGLDSFHVR